MAVGSRIFESANTNVMIYDFSGRFMAAFGYVPGSVVGLAVDSQFPLKVETYLNDGQFDDQVELYQDAKSDKNSYLFAFRSFSDDYKSVFATPPMFSLRRAKKLIESQIDNSDIVVVERYGTEPYEITWRGLLIDMENHRFPLDKLEAINRIFEVNAEWNVSSQILNSVGVEAIYVKEINIEFVEGYEDTVAYTLVTKAIKPLEYQLANQ